MTAWHEWRRQALALAAVEARRRVLGKGAVPVLLLSAAAVAIAFIRFLFAPPGARVDLGRTTSELAETFHYFLLLFVVFFGSAAVFGNLYRGEVLDRTLHYTLMLPMRREVVAVGKYLGALAAAVAAFGATTLATIVLYYLAHGPARAFAFLLSGRGLADAGAYLGMVALACAAYGALFLLLGLVFRNPMIPAVVFLGWEYLVPFLPPVLKVFSVAHALSSLAPVPIQNGPFSILGEPTSPWLAVPGLLLLAAGLLALAAWRAGRLQVSYATE